MRRRDFRNARPLSTVLGEGLRALRESAGVRQDTLAAAARECGLAWTRVTVTAVERGRRQLSLGEFLVLPFVLERAGLPAQFEATTPDGERRRVHNCAELIPNDDSEILIAGARRSTGHMTAPARTVRFLIAGWDGLGPSLSGIVPDRYAGLPRRRIGAAAEAAAEAERKAARALGVSALDVALAARRRWQRSLTDERDSQVAARSANVPPRRLQAVRGHITRKLLSELRQLLEKDRKAGRSRKRVVKRSLRIGTTNATSAGAGPS